VEADCPGEDAEGTQLLGKPDFGGAFAVVLLHPGAGGEHGVEAFEQLACEHTIAAGGGEQDEDVEEKRGDWSVVVGSVAQGDGGVAAYFGPFATGEIGEGQERFPDSGMIVSAFSGTSRWIFIIV
jgi:hypothetical protein